MLSLCGGGSSNEKGKSARSDRDERKLFIFNWPFSLHTFENTRKKALAFRAENFCIEPFKLIIHPQSFLLAEILSNLLVQRDRKSVHKR